SANVGSEIKNIRVVGINGDGIRWSVGKVVGQISPTLSRVRSLPNMANAKAFNRNIGRLACRVMRIDLNIGNWIGPQPAIAGAGNSCVLVDLVPGSGARAELEIGVRVHPNLPKIASARGRGSRALKSYINHLRNTVGMRPSNCERPDFR